MVGDFITYISEWRQLGPIFIFNRVYQNKVGKPFCAAGGELSKWQEEQSCCAGALLSERIHLDSSPAAVGHLEAHLLLAPSRRLPLAGSDQPVSPSHPSSSCISHSPGQGPGHTPPRMARLRPEGPCSPLPDSRPFSSEDVLLSKEMFLLNLKGKGILKAVYSKSLPVATSLINLVFRVFIQQI